MNKDIQFPDKIMNTNYQSKNNLSVINKLELESFKKKDLIKTNVDINEDQLVDKIKKNEKINKYLENSKIIKKIFIPNRLINLITK